MLPSVSFIGLGHMGRPMATNLIKAGYCVKIYDIIPEAMTALIEQGGIPASSLANAAEDCDIIITMLQTGKQVREVCLADNGLFAHAKANTLYIDSSSIEIDITRQLHLAADERRLAMLDAPVSGGVGGALAGTLTIMVGGKETHYQRAHSLLSILGKKIIHAGSAGHGQAAKICNNLILGISMIAVSEGFNLAKKLELDPKKFFEISSNASGQCWSMTSYCPEPNIIDKALSNNQYQPGFMAEMMLKDLRLGQHAAEIANASIPLGATAAELYNLFVNKGNGDIDFSAIIKLL